MVIVVIILMLRFVVFVCMCVCWGVEVICVVVDDINDDCDCGVGRRWSDG